MRVGQKFLLLAILAALAVPAVASAVVVLPKGGNYAGQATAPHDFRGDPVHFHFRQKSSHASAEIQNFYFDHHLILNRGHVSDHGLMDTSQNGVRVTAEWQTRSTVTGTITVHHVAVHYSASLQP